MARYIDHAVRAGYEIPYTVARLIGMPPVALAKNSQSVATAAAGHSMAGNPRRQNNTPTKGRPVGGAPALPSPVKVEPMKFA